MNMIPKSRLRIAATLSALAILTGAMLPTTASASSHMDAPLVTLDPAANTTDLYAFLTQRAGQKYLQVSLGVYPHEEPGVGPNKYNFDDNVLYQIFLSTGDDLASGADSIAYQFKFSTTYKNDSTILQSYLGVVSAVDDANQNLTQTYTVTRVVNGVSTELGTGVVPPNNQGIATPGYNVGGGEGRAKDGVVTPATLDPYTAQSIATLTDGYRSFAGQREDGFYGDVQSIFDLLQLRSGDKTFDSQGGYNMHSIALEIPVSEIGGDQQVVGVYATTSRRASRVLTSTGDPVETGPWVQVGRQGNPLFAEAMIGIKDKDLYNRTKPTQDAALFRQYASEPELAALINAIVFSGQAVAPTTGRTDLVGIFIPDLLKVDLSTGPARLTGGGLPDEGHSRLSVFGGDALTSEVQAGLPGFPAGTIAGGWPNGRRYGDDVIDIAVTAIISDLRTDPLTIRSADGIDNMSFNDAVYNKTFPYAATPHSGRNYIHNGGEAVSPLFNLSIRGAVGNGYSSLISGFIIRGTEPVTVLVRGLGPTLETFDVEGALGDPVIQVWKDGSMVAMNDSWGETQRADIQDTGYAPAYANEAAVIVTLQPGAYTTLLNGVDGGTGIGLLDVFLVE
ncbi:DUF4331 domain-containing protein [Synoicihabitans lomoniglobus]|uniref:DUF4331 domain-containing protein n=1 Tax=Synoicihabitans lomoniglobus TaxID=2909285 RepID=A0AAE9ZV63_9BACT|nr:DUF4331 domain-containing protein [Opitutaceae bacterium LMO-M01]WED63971.1 DUF4331 domain-containing protein [Opitutaceae bacterium LMO-M01]